VVFSWDPRKAVSNRRKHGIDFHEAATVMSDGLAMTFPDVDHATPEARFVTVGVSSRGSVLVVVHSEDKRGIRIISARRATRRERKFYEEGQ
jgi:uncharacterized protein